MKKIFKVLGIIALVTVIGFSFTACGDDSGGTPVPVTGVSLNKKSLSLAVGGSETLTATVAPDNATNKNVTWTTSDATKATVSKGVVTAVATGKATITVTTADGKKTATCAVTVTGGSSTVSVTGVSLNKSSLSLAVGGSETLTATVAPSNATNKAVTWTSSDSTKATVTNGGVVTAVATGSVTITVKTADGNKTATCTVNVTGGGSIIAVTGVSLNKTSLSLAVGSSETLTANVTPSNATNKNVTWTSSDTTKATVTDGVVRAVATGSTTITVKTADGNKTATCAVTVTGGSSGGGGSVTIEMVSIPAGTFTMGSPSTETGSQSNERPQHSVTLSSFKMGKYQVTQEQYQAVMGSNPSNFKTAVDGESGTPGKLPVENVSWYDALVFCNKLSVNEGLSPAYSISGSTDPTVWGTVPTSSNTTWNAVVIVSGSTGYRLPTEAQWEYACRAGTTTAYNTGDTISDNTGWYSSNSGSKTHQVGLKPANAWGLYDMHGNVNEWCWDWYNSSYYSSSPANDPTGAGSGSGRVLRGGSWNYSAGDTRSTARSYYYPFNWDSSLGFRLVRP